MFRGILRLTTLPPEGRMGQFTYYIVWDATITNGLKIYIALLPTYS